MDHQTAAGKGLPENAYKELKAGEEYRPIMDPAGQPQEVTPYSVITGMLMAILFSAAAAYSGLKIGQVFEAAIPIAILAVGTSTLLKKKNALGQNVIIQSIGAASGVIVAGAIFTIPALYILELPASFYQGFWASACGGCRGGLCSATSSFVWPSPALSALIVDDKRSRSSDSESGRSIRFCSYSLARSR